MMKKILITISLFFSVLHVFSQNWQLVWQDEFNYTGLPNSSKWGYDTGAGGWGNNELENYTENREENARVENGNLVLEARRDWFKGYEYSSARLVSKNKGDWKYGRVEVKAKIPVGKGLWPAIWMLPTDGVYGGWPASGEIDIMENFALNGITPYEIEGNVHTKSYNHIIGTNKGGKIHNLSHIESNYHIYAVNWYKDRLEFEVDGNIYFTFQNEGNWEAWPYDQRFHLILNIAVGGTLGTTPDASIFPKQMLVDYIRVYQQTQDIPSTTGIMTVFEHCNYTGFSSGLSVGNYSTDDLKQKGMDDNKISSLKILEGYKAILYSEDNFQGTYKEIFQTENCFDNRWNDKVSSIQIIPNGKQDMDGRYFLKNKNSNLYLDVAGGEVAIDNGVNLHQWELTNTRNQEFRFEHLENGVYKIIAEHSEKSLDVAKSTGNLQQWEYTGVNNQQFILVSSTNESFKLIPLYSGKIIEVANANLNRQANVQEQNNNNQENGKWYFIPSQIVHTQHTKKEIQFRISPNPVSNTVVVNFSKKRAGKTVLVLENINGQIIRKVEPNAFLKGNYEYPIDVTNLSTGLYVLKLFVNDTAFAVRFNVIH